jgi:hypothetical protein
MLVVVRPKPEWLVLLSQNPALQDIPKIVIGQQPVEVYKKFCSGKWTPVMQPAKEGNKARIQQELYNLFRSRKVSHVLVTQKLLWYSTVVEMVCASLRIPLTWCEAFFDDRIIMDRTGLQYCKDNDLKFDSIGPMEPPLLPKSTREPQPGVTSVAEMQAKVPESRDAVVVFGQTPYDMSLKERPGIGYLEWMDAMFRGNPDTRFLFKHHPLAKTPGIEKHSNVTAVNASLDSLFEAFELFASFSSTTIFEGMIRGRSFATGGYHFCSGLTLPVHNVVDARDLVRRLREYTFSADAWARRLFFICNRYTIPLNSPHLWERLNQPSKTFFEGHKPTLV